MKTAAPRKVRVTYTHWADKRTHRTVTEYALVRGSWIYTQSGLRKRADGTNIRVDETYKRAPRGTALMRPTSAPPEGQHRSSRRSNAA